MEMVHRGAGVCATSEQRQPVRLEERPQVQVERDGRPDVQSEVNERACGGVEGSPGGFKMRAGAADR